jgi:hypothetical protein
MSAPIAISVGSKLRNLLDSRVATVKEIRSNRVLVTIEGSREWLDNAEIKALWRSNSRPA